MYQVKIKINVLLKISLSLIVFS